MLGEDLGKHPGNIYPEVSSVVGIQTNKNGGLASHGPSMGVPEELQGSTEGQSFDSEEQGLPEGLIEDLFSGTVAHGYSEEILETVEAQASERVLYKASVEPTVVYRGPARPVTRQAFLEG